LGRPLFFGGGSDAREKRWEKLILACLLGDQNAAESLVAICNLDWGNFGSENDIPKSNLTDGANTVVPVVAQMSPRLVVPLSRLVWTYLPPVLPIVGLFDGIVSCLRTYSPTELRELSRGLDSYDWEIGEKRNGWSPLVVTYLVGVPKR